MIKILAIDDKNDNLISLKAILKDIFTDAVVFTALSGPKGIELAAVEDPDVILLDVVMPGMDGFEVCRRLKEDPILSEIPVVFLTALKESKENRHHALEIGAEAFLSKPIDETELTAQIRAMVKIKAANELKRNEKEHLTQLVAERTRDLGERIKELNCLYGIAEAIAKPGITFEGIIEETLNHLQPALQYPEITCARIIIDNTDNKTDNFLETKWKLSADIKVRGGITGEVIVCYLEEKTESDNGPFLIEEKNLIEAVAERLGRIYERKQAEMELLSAKEKTEESEKYLDKIINNIGDPVFVKDEQSRFLLVNDAFCEILEMSKDEIIGKTLGENLPPDEMEHFFKIDQLVLKNGQENLCEESLTVRGKKTRTISTKKTRFIDDKGKRILIGLIRDITKQKQIHYELLTAKEKAEESDHLKTAFLTNMSHEIRTPMNGILGFAELLKEPNLTSDDLKDYVQIIQISGARMLSTINDVVNISKIEAGLVQVDIKETNINEKIEFTCNFFKREAENKKLQLSFKNGLQSKDAIIKTDNEKVYGILTNLVKNAIKFTYDGSIELGYELKGEYLEFFVKDSGIGISHKQKELVFERFRQGSESHDRGYEGSGLGLSISKSYVEMLGGEIWVESEEGIGSTFYFTIPYNAVSEEKTINENTFSEKDKEVQLKKLKILIVEDDETSHSLLTHMLQNINSEVLHAITGIEAIEACRTNPDLDLVLMDIRMPMMDGNEATRQIRQFNKDVIIIAQTAYAFSGDKEKSIEAGCNNFITKPINKTALHELIKIYFNNS
jgi:PAS domain S-box-containing protein